MVAAPLGDDRKRVPCTPFRRTREADPVGGYKVGVYGAGCTVREK